MGTRSIIVFKNEYNETHTYIHWDGYPSNRLVELQKFLEWNKPRNHDVAYATANLVFWYKLESLKAENVFDEHKQIKTLEDMLTPREKDDDIHRGIGIVDSKFDDYRYKYVVDFDAKTILVTGGETDVTVAFGQVVQFNDQDEIIQEETPIPA